LLACQCLDDADSGLGAIKPHIRFERRILTERAADRLRQRNRRKLSRRQDTGKAALRQTSRAQRLLGFLTDIEGHEHGRSLRSQQIDRRVVSGLAD
jgi:hypothetical protein